MFLHIARCWRSCPCTSPCKVQSRLKVAEMTTTAAQRIRWTFETQKGRLNRFIFAAREAQKRKERERERQRLYLGRLAMSFILDSHSPTFLALLLSVEEETATQVRADVRRLALCGSPCSVETSRRSTAQNSESCW
ncbi:hypothetical protein PROFUN_17120 [Planoprotostelium fungivorum]|uniref:Uncharacterized protein n=1 Tax=Planoprotostelium fungivorum TaxID=1890364 RepID=A0A2P6MMB6_9EUKA|nr:hypothetical protein PROFUN_17120 [Planoprotostelium fungivorum]